ncbi:MAG: hypothetical protein ACRD3W_09375, partial [Terriglobales bacterium]
MRSLLMHKDRDFDPGQLLSRKDKAPYGRRGEEGISLHELLPWNEAALTQDLALNVLTSAMAAGDVFLFDVAKVGLLSSLTDADTILYRQRILSDCLKNAAVVRSIYQIAVEAVETERKHYLSLFTRYPAGILH